MTTITNRGAQVRLGGLARDAARGVYASTLLGNSAEKLALELAGTWPDGSTSNGTTLTGAPPVEELLATPDGIVSPTAALMDLALDGVSLSVENTITAHAGGTQAAAYVLTQSISCVTIIATNADSVRLPTAVAGRPFIVINADAAQSLQVFGAGTATINDVATATGVALAAGKVGIYFAVEVGKLYGGALA